MKDSSNFFLQEPEPYDILFSLLAGMVSRIQYAVTRLRPRNHSKQVKQFFNSARGHEDDYGITDGTHPAIQAFLMHYIDLAIPKAYRKNLKLLDIGSGSLTLHELLHKNGIKPTVYTGIDITQKHNTKYAGKHKEIDLVEADLEKPFNGTLPKHTCVFAINLLPYLNNLEPFFKLVEISRAMRLVIIEPIPTWYWMKFFSGIVLHYRTEKQLCTEAKRHGWNTSATRMLWFRSKGGLVIWPVSKMFVFERD